MTHLQDTELTPSLLKLAIVWLATFTSSITLQQVMIFVTIVYTLVQLFILVRDKIVRDGTQEKE